MSDDHLTNHQAENLLRAMKTPDVDPDTYLEALRPSESRHGESNSPAPQGHDSIRPQPFESGKTFRIDGGHAEHMVSEDARVEEVDSEEARSEAVETRGENFAYQSKLHSSTTPRDAYDDTSARILPTEPVRDYDFRQPPRVSRDQIRALHSLHAQVAQRFSESLNEVMRGDTTVRLVDVTQCGHHEFVYGLDDPACLAVIQPDSLDGHWLSSVQPAVAFAMMDRMLGGDPCPGENVQRPMTDIEIRLIERVFDGFAEALNQSWASVLPLQANVTSIKSHPECLPDVTANDRMVKIRFDVSVSQVRGDVYLCMPVKSTIESLRDQFSGDHWCDQLSGHPIAGTEATRRVMAGRLGHAPIDVVVNLASSTIRTGDLLGLSVGDIIATEKTTQDALELAIQDIPKFTARAGAYQGKKAVQIESIIDTAGSEEKTVETLSPMDDEQSESPA